MRNVCILSTLLLLLVGCRGPSGDTGAMIDAQRPTVANGRGQSFDDTGPALAARQGLQIRRILMPNDDATFRRALASVCSDGAASGRRVQDALDEELSERWRRNGLRFVRMTPGQAETFVQSLGAVMVDRDEWMGEILEWSALENSVTDELRALAVEQRIERFQPGEFQLMLRGWTMPTEIGPRLYLEFLARYHQPLKVNYLDLVQHADDALPGVILDPVSLPVVIEPDAVYLLTSASPVEVWPTDGPRETAGTPVPAAPNRGAGRGPGTGPVAVAPTTVGEQLMIEQGAPARRTILLLQAQTGSARTARTTPGSEPG
ncbi:MAG: hypothetical protein KC983_06810 [Phycisphaerales bacterium]|nr:hypothetical protein [Phycisphaerales bacterium]